MKFQIGQVNIRFTMSGVEITAPIAGKQVQVTIIPQNKDADTEVQLFVEHRYIGHISIGGDKIPF